jgi:hypothetical protein
MTQPDLANRLVDLLADLNPEAVLWAGLNDAVVGIGLRDGLPVAIYDYDGMVGVFMQNEGWTRDDAVEWLDFNVLDAYVGPGTPLVGYVRDPWDASDDDDDDDDGNDGGTFFDAGEA